MERGGETHTQMLLGARKGGGGSAAAAVRGAEGARTHARTQTRTHSLQGPFEQLCLLHVGFLFLLKENSAGAEMKN